MEIKTKFKAILFFCLLFYYPLAFALPAGFQSEIVVSGLEEPVYLAQLPDTRMLVLTKNGAIYIFDPSDSPAQPSLYLTLPDVSTGSERGLTSIAIDPDFETSGSIYVFYSNVKSQRFRISRFTHQGNTADLSSEVVIWEDNEDFSNCCHYGGGLQFGPDGKLYLATGEEFDSAQAQDLTRAGGKIIRINKDGSIPVDNPFIDGAGGNLDAIWAYGLRNPYRMYWDLVRERLYISEVGGNVIETAREDIHLGRAGANYGWPYCEGSCGNSAYDDPIYSYSHQGGTPSGGAVTAGTVYRGAMFPSSYNEVFFFADYALGFIRYLTFDGAGNLTGDFDFADNSDDLGAPVHVIQGADGALYYVDYIGAVKRIVYSSGNQAPEITDIQVTPSEGNSPLTVDFYADAFDLEGDSLSYVWSLGDGNSSTGQLVSYLYENNGVYNAYVSVSDGDRATLSPFISIQVGEKPIVDISYPTDGMYFRAGDIINFVGTASDPDGVLTDDSYEWNIDFGHNQHTHPVLSGFTGTTGQLEINTSGHDYHDSTNYVIELQVTDSDGLKAYQEVTIYPDKVNLNYSTVPAGIPVFVDGLPQTSPFVYDTLIGFNHVISVPEAYCINDVAYEFSSWSNGQPSTHSLVVPDTDVSFEAVFQAIGQCGNFPTSGLVFSVSGDVGVQVADGVVTDWLDQSGLGNHLVAAGNPTWLTDRLNGHDVVAFDGIGDSLVRSTGVVGLPTGNSDRTVIAIVNYHGLGLGGVSFGDTGCNNTFGMVVDGNGYLTLQGWCTDFSSSTAVTGTGWLVQSVVLENGYYRHFKDGIEIDSGFHNFSTPLSRIVLGSEIDGRPSVDMEIAGVYIYDRALSDLELADANNFIQNSYFTVIQGEPPVAQDDAATAVQGDSVVIDVLANDSDTDGSIVPSSIVISTPPSFGSTSIDYVNGTITYQHDGSANLQDNFTYVVNDDQGLISNNATVTVDLTAAVATVSIASPIANELINGLDVVVDYSTSGVDFDHVELSLDGGVAVDVTGATGNYTFTNVEAGTHTVTAQLVNSAHQALVVSGATDTVSFQVENTGIPYAPVVVNDTASVAQGESVAISVLANDTDDNGDLDVSSVEIVASPNVGALSVDSITGVVTYTHDGSNSYSDSFGYRVYDLTGLVSNEGTVAITITGAGPGVPTSGLVLRLEADEGVQNTAGTVTLWQDLSGLGNDLDQVLGDPQLIAGALNGHAVVDFDGSGDEMSRLANFSGLPEGSADRTVVVVANYRGLGYGGFAYGTASSGKTFGLGVTNAGELFVQRWSKDHRSGVTGTGAGWLVQSATLSSSGLTHYLNGSIIDTGSNNFNTALTKIVLGAEIDGSPDVDMQVAAIYVYDRVLTAQELSAVQVELDSFYLNPPVQGEPPIASNDVIDVVQGGTVDIAVLANDSDVDGNLAVDTVAIVSAPSSGVATVDATTGVITYQHGGATTASDSFTYSVEDDVGNVSNIATVSIGVLTPNAVVTITSPYSGEVISGVDVVVTYSLAGTDYDHLHLSMDNQGHNTIRDLTGTFTFTNVAAGTHTVSAQLVNSAHQALVTEDAYDEVTFTVENTGVPYAPVVVDDSASVMQGESVAIPVLANDTDDNGDLDVSSVEIVSSPNAGVLSVNATTGVVTYTHDGSTSYSDSFTYRVYDLTGLVSNEGSVAITINGAGPGVPTSGLVLRLEADEGVQNTAGTVTLWQDLSGLGNDLDQVLGDPQLIAGALNGHAVVDFDGSGDEMSRLANFSGLPEGSADRTVVVVANYRGLGYGGFAYGTPSSGKTFGLGVTNAGDLFVQRWSRDHRTSVAGTGAGWLVQSATLSSSGLTHYLNGSVIDTGSNNFNTALTKIVLGAEIDGSPDVDMQVAAIYVYDRVLSAQEISAVQVELDSFYLTPPAQGEPPVATNDVADVVQGGAVDIAVLANDSDPDGNLALGSVSIVTAPSSGVATVDTATGVITYQHGGATTASDSFTYSVEDDQGNVSNIATVSIGVLTPNAVVTITSPYSGEVISGLDVVVTYSLAGTDYDHLHLSMDNLGHNTIRDLTGSFTFTNVEAGTHTVSAQLVNSAHQALVTEDAYDEVTFTVENTGVPYAPVVADDSASVAQGGSVAISVLANDTDDNGDLDVSSVEIVTAPNVGALSVDATGVVTYTHDGSTSYSDSFTYRVYDLTGLVSNEGVVSITITGAGPGVPTSGLVLRLEADEGVQNTAGTVTLWQDLSGQGNDLDQVLGDPQLIAGALNGHAVVDFDGSGDEMDRLANFSGLPEGSADRTVVVVANYRGLGYGGFAYGTPSSGKTFGLGVTNGGDLFVQRWSRDHRTSVAGTGAGWLVQTATLSSSGLTHYLNGSIIDTGSNNFNTALTKIVLGAEIDGSPDVDMQVAAVYVYDRVLTAAELANLHANLLAYYLP